MLAAFVPLVPILTSWPRFVDSDRTYKQLDEIIDHMDKGSTYLVLKLGPTNDYWLYSPITGMGHIVARLGGRGLYDNTDSLASPVHLRADRAWTHIYERLDMHSYRFMPPFNLTRFRYVILHTTDWSVNAVVSKAIEPEARFVFRSGEWTLIGIDPPSRPTERPRRARPAAAPAHATEARPRARGEDATGAGRRLGATPGVRAQVGPVIPREPPVYGGSFAASRALARATARSSRLGG